VAGAAAADRLVLTFDQLVCFWAGTNEALRDAAAGGSPLRVDTVPALDVNELLGVLRRVALHRWDIHPAMDCPPSFLRDQPALQECFVLGLEREDGPGARSYHFT
jgi:hypothetical protein